MADEWMLIGRVAAPFGVRGEMKIEPLTDFPERFNSLTVVYVGPTRERHKVERTRMHGDRILVRLDGVSTPEQVGDYRGAELFVPRGEASPLPPGHFYLEDAVGLEVETTEGTAIGTVTEVLKTGSNEVFVVGRDRGAVLIPVIKDAIAELDMDRRRVVVEPWILTQE
jgi:16S rRNA processing protein RimM